MRLTLAILLACAALATALTLTGTEYRSAIRTSVIVAALVWCIGHYIFGKIVASRMKPFQYGRAEPTDSELTTLLVDGMRDALNSEIAAQSNAVETYRKKNAEGAALRCFLAVLMIIGAIVGVESTSRGYLDPVCQRWDANTGQSDCPWKSNYRAEMAAREHVAYGEYRAARSAVDDYGLEGIDPLIPREATAAAAWLYGGFCYDKEAYLKATLLEKHRVTFEECADRNGYK